MTVQMEELLEFIQANPDTRELKRALAVQMLMQNYSHSAIGSILGVSGSFISKWKYIFVEQGVAGLRLKYKGSKSYLAPAEKQIVLNWLKQNSFWHLSELKQYIEDNFNVEFESNQSYYDLFKQANISWKKTKEFDSSERLGFSS